MVHILESLPREVSARIREVGGRSSGQGRLRQAKVSTVDAHLHLDVLLSRQKAENIEELARRREPNNFHVRTFICSVNFLPAIRQMEALAPNPKLRFSVGLHPHVVSRPVHRDVHQRVKRLLQDPRCVALGEVGLDYHGHQRGEERRAQAEYLEEMAGEARRRRMPIVIHCRPDHQSRSRARRDCIRILQRQLPKDYPVYVHSFYEDLAALREWTRAFPGAHFGLGQQILDGHDEVLREIEFGQWLLESDAPYQATHPWRLLEVVQKMAAVRNLAVSMIVDQAGRNADNFFRL